jgi:hypothetical protein
MLSSWLGLPWRMALEPDPIGQFSATSGPRILTGFLPFGTQDPLAKKTTKKKKLKNKSV